jgi:hypothetical protein
LQKDELMELTLGKVWKMCVKYSGGFLLSRYSILQKGIMPKIFIELNIDRKYSNPHLNLNTWENFPK